MEKYLRAHVRYFKFCVLNEIKQPRKLMKVQQHEPSSKYKKQSPKLQQDRMKEPQEKHKAIRIGSRAQQ